MSLPSHSVMRRLPALTLLCALTVGCTDKEQQDASTRDTTWRAEIDTIADTVTVRTIAGSEWDSAQLVEELRIGSADGEEHLMFGHVGALAVHRNGDIVIYDSQAKELRRFDANGKYVGPIFRAGSGPGEYKNVIGMAVLSDDRLVVHDFGNRRYIVYSAEGHLLDTWVLNTNVGEWRPVYTRGNGIFLFDQIRRNGATEEFPTLVQLDEHGVAGDSIKIPLGVRVTPSLQVRSATQSFGMYVPYYPEMHWTVTPTGEVVTADGGRYAIDVHRRDGTVIRMTRAFDAVAVTQEERTAEEERITARFQRVMPTWSWDGARIPETKPPIGWLHAAQDGSLWVGTAQPGAPIPAAERDANARTSVREPRAFDVFASDGHYRGHVVAPDRMQLAPYPVLGENSVWAVVRDADDVNYVARLRIVRTPQK